MSRTIGNQLPSVLLTALSEEALSVHLDIAVPIVSVDERGRPHPALLSYGELAGVSPGAIRLVIGGKSRTAANLRRNGYVALLFVGPATSTEKQCARTRGGMPTTIRHRI